MSKGIGQNYDDGALDAHSQYRKRVSVEEGLNSRMIAEPIALITTVRIGDGGAAVVAVHILKAYVFSS